MTLLLGILLAFSVFLLIVLVHEFGHFFTARKTGMKVEEFGIGIPPKVGTLFRDKTGTEYTFNLFPMGGFVKIFWEDPTDANAKKSGAFMSKPWWARALVLVAWVAMNFLLAWGLFSLLFVVHAKPISLYPLSDGPTHSYFLPSFDEALTNGTLSFSGIEFEPLTWSIAELSWIKKGDVLVSLNGKEFSTPKAVIDEIRGSQKLDLMLLRAGKKLNLTVIPKDGKIGAYLNYHNLQIVEPKGASERNFSDALVLWARETYSTSVLTLKAFSTLLHGILFPKNPEEHESAKEMLSGPIGIGATFVDIVKIGAGWKILVFIIAILSVNLWVLNILPFPALDGGRIVTTTLYSLVVRFFGKSEQIFLTAEKYFHAIWFLLLLMLMLYVAGLDISRIFF